MKLDKFLLTLAGVLAATALSATPAAARGAGHDHGHHDRNQAQSTPAPKSQTGMVRQVTLSNSGNQPLSGIRIGFSGKDSAEFSETDNCGRRLASGDSCTINVTFAPTSAGTKSATLDVSSSAGSRSVALSGTGI